MLQIPSKQKGKHDPLTRPITFTWFPDRFAKRKREHDFSLHYLAERIELREADTKERLPFIKGARFGDQPSGRKCFRYNDNVIAITAIEADYDAGDISPEDARWRLEEAVICGLIYTTPSHRKPGKGHRWRVICPLSRERLPEERSELVARLNGLFDGMLAPESFVLSQSFYYGGTPDGTRIKTYLVTGGYIDEADDLKAVWPDKWEKGAPQPIDVGSQKKAFDHDLDLLREAVMAIPNADDGNDGYHDWLGLGVCLHFETDGKPEGLAIWDAWSKQSELYDEHVVKAKWRSFNRGYTGARRTGASLIKWAQQYGWQKPREKTAPPVKIQTSAEFVADFVPPDWLMYKLLQKGYLYALTAPTGCGKTAIALLIAAHVAEGEDFDFAEVEQGRVLYLAGENPDDARVRWMVMCEEMGLNPRTIPVHFVAGRFSIEEQRQQIETAASEIGGFSLIFVDTSATFFVGDEENSNAQALDHAHMLRRLTRLPGEPTVVVLCHPTKYATSDNLLPRGGGSFLAEIDTNLVCLFDAMRVDVHWQGKVRGPDFLPIPFQLSQSSTQKVADKKGRPWPTVIAKPLSDKESAEADARLQSDEDALLAAMRNNEGASLSKLAEELNWLYKNKEGNRSRVNRTMHRLDAEKLVKKRHNTWYLTDRGKAKKAVEKEPEKVKQ